MLTEHRRSSYWNKTRGGYYCQSCGEIWPCTAVKIEGLLPPTRRVTPVESHETCQDCLRIDMELEVHKLREALQGVYAARHHSSCIWPQGGLCSCLGVELRVLLGKGYVVTMKDTKEVDNDCDN